MCSALPLALGFAFEALGLRSCPPAHVSALLEVREPETFFSPGRIRRLRGGRGLEVEATCAGTKQEVTAGVEPGEPVAVGADGSGEGAGEGTLVSRLFSPSGPGSLAVTRECSGLEKAKGCPGEGRSWRTSRGLWQVAEERGCSGPLCSTLG